MKKYIYAQLPTSSAATSAGEVGMMLPSVTKSASFKRTVSLIFLFIVTFYLVISLLNTSQNLVLVEDDKPLEHGQIQFELEQCGCKRRLNNVHNNPPDLLLNKTTCGMDAFRRGPGQKIVGFSFYGDINSDYSKKKGYFEGIIGNLELMPKYYPGWIMRLYYDLDKTDPVLKDLCKLACNDPNIDICDAKHLPGTPFIDASKVFAMNWRFFPTLDPQVDYYISRDLDSRFSDREQAAVQEWLNSNKDFHVMRDHPGHGAKLLGSGWGSKLIRQEVRLNWKMAWNKGMTDKKMWAKRNDYGPDQGFLARYVWPWAKGISIGHDSYLCKRYKYTQAFPTQRKKGPNNFVASVVDILLSRDLDSRFSEREVAAVTDWLETDKSIHAMRDNPSHGIGLLGASWGTQLTKDNARARWRKSWVKIFQDGQAWASRKRKGPDQFILKKYVWQTWGHASSVQHDSYLCAEYPGSIGFPTQRKMEPNNYVASVWKDREMIQKKCPSKCRRKPEWIYC